MACVASGLSTGGEPTVPLRSKSGSIGSMESEFDPYARLASLLWILKPVDVIRLAEVAEGLAEERLATFLGSAGPEPSQATLRPQNRS